MMISFLPSYEVVRHYHDKGQHRFLLFSQLLCNSLFFSFTEVEFGDILGSGTFGLVREVKSIKIFQAQGNVTKNELDFDFSNSKVLSQNDVSDPRLSFAMHRRRSGNSVSSRELASDMCIRNGDARFAVKYLMVEDMCEDQILRARIDLAIEVNYLKVLSHPHVVKVRGVMKTKDPFHPKFFFLMDKLYGTLHDKIAEWDKVQRCKRFNVKHLLQKAIGVKNCQSFTNDFMKQRLYIAHDIATALRYMHSKRVIHRYVQYLLEFDRFKLEDTYSISSKQRHQKAEPRF
jgi:serine/threonine protein kinase